MIDMDNERVWFWSRLGFLPDPPGFSSNSLDVVEAERFLKFHRQMDDAGDKAAYIHSTIRMGRR
jgi:hypothetical protein